MDRRINNSEQVAYVRRYALTDGAAAGIKVVEVYNGVLRFLLNESKALDIMQLFHKGTNISYLSKNAFTKRETTFLKRFEGGMLYTCGIDVIGGQAGYEDHGSFHNIPAQITKCECTEDKITIEAIIRDTELFGKNLVMKRRYETEIGSDTVTLFDTLINERYHDEGYSILYHVNVGYPMLDDGVKIQAETNKITPRNAWAEKHIDKAFDIEAPEDGKEETCYLLDMKKPQISVVNKKLGKKLTLSYSEKMLPHFVEWKSMASGDYALGLEPSTSLLDDKFAFSKIGKQDELHFSISLRVETI